MYKKIFAKVYDPFMAHLETHLGPRRETLLHGLKGDILDVGSGTGVNFQYFSKEARVIAIEPSAPMMSYAKPKLAQYPNIEMYNLGVNDDEMDKIIPDNSLDYVISTLVLCTIPDPHKAIASFKRWLKPTGKLVVLEHIKSNNKVFGVVSEVFNPIWHGLADGCNINRHTDQYLLDAGFIPENHFYSGGKLRWVQGVYGLAV